MRKDLQADLMLLFVALSWGASNLAISTCLTELSPLTINIFRFIAAVLTVAILGFKKLRTINLTTVKYAFLMGIFLTGNYFFTNIGIANTTLSNAGFYCGLAVIFAPVGEWIFFGKKPDRKLWLVIAICFVGVFLMSMKGDFSVNTANLKGDIFCICCALSYTGNILITDKAVMDERTDAYNLGALQIGFTLLWSTVLASMFENVVLPHSGIVIFCLIFLGVLCTGLAFVIQPIAQQYTTGTHVGLILALEPVFCAIIAFLFAGEVLFAQNYVGMVLLMIGIVILEIDFKPKKEKK